ncbi:MAG: DNRLRE domain-containing protein [Pirellulales bacterium]|nr:DNRLRE domain-containing protein [Pirellulales bacterium]
MVTLVASSAARQATLLVVIHSLFISYCGAREVTYVIQEGRLGSCTDVMISIDPRLEKHNLGGMDFIAVWQHDGVSLVRFNLDRIPKKALVTKASLKLYCNSVGFADEEIRRDWPIAVHSFEHKWREGTGTDKSISRNGTTIKTFDGKKPWPKGSPLASAGTRLGAIVHRGGAPRWYEWPLKVQVINEWISGKRPNNGMIVWGKAPGKAVSFSSSESPRLETRPQLTLTVTIPDK